MVLGTRSTNSARRGARMQYVRTQFASLFCWPQSSNCDFDISSSKDERLTPLTINARKKVAQCFLMSISLMFPNTETPHMFFVRRSLLSWKRNRFTRCMSIYSVFKSLGSFPPHRKSHSIYCTNHRKYSLYNYYTALSSSWIRLWYPSVCVHLFSIRPWREGRSPCSGRCSCRRGRSWQPQWSEWRFEMLDEF